MNTLRFSAFSSKREYNKFMSKVNRKASKSNKNSKKLRLVQCNGFVKITGDKQIVNNWRGVNNGGLIHFVDKNDHTNLCSSEQFDQIMRAK